MGQMSKKPKNFEKNAKSKSWNTSNRWLTYGCEVCDGDFRKDIWVSILVPIYYQYFCQSIDTISIPIFGNTSHTTTWPKVRLCYPLNSACVSTSYCTCCSVRMQVNEVECTVYLCSVTNEVHAKSKGRITLPWKPEKHFTNIRLNNTFFLYVCTIARMLITNRFLPCLCRIPNGTCTSLGVQNCYTIGKKRQDMYTKHVVTYKNYTNSNFYTKGKKETKHVY